MVSFARHLTFYQNRLSLGKSLRDLHIDAIGKSGSHFFFLNGSITVFDFHIRCRSLVDDRFIRNIDNVCHLFSMNVTFPVISV